MPPINYYTVTEERQVKIAASTPETAILIASRAFATGQGVTEDEGRTLTIVKTISLAAREDY